MESVKDGSTHVYPSAELHAPIPSHDFVVLCLPLTKETNCAFGKSELALMKPGAALINISRGEIVDWDAACSALHAGALSAFYTDVTVPEPLSDGDPNWKVPNL